MRPDLLRILACPSCGADLDLRAAVTEGEHVVEGALSCTGCHVAYPIVGSVPRLCTGEHHAGTQRNFGAQWSLRLDGEFEGKGSLYGDDPDRLVGFLVDHCLGGVGKG